MSRPEPRVLHVSTGLAQGGAERQLALICSRMRASSMVFALREPGPMVDEIETAGIRLASGHAGHPWSAGWIRPLRQTIRHWRPDVVMGWMYHGNLAASLTRLLGFRGPLFWNVRHSVASLADERRATRKVIRLGARFSGLPHAIVYNSVVAAGQHEAMGYCSAGRVVIANGFDTERFRPSQERRVALRRELGLAEDAWLLGVVGRAHPMKNHSGWLDALVALRAAGRSVHCLMVGTDMDHPAFAAEVRQRGLDGMVALRPGTSAPETLYPGLDLLVLPSRWGEAFPNVVGEAMACGVPALVTDVGDAAALVGDTGFVAADATPRVLAAATGAALDTSRDALVRRGQAARARIMNEYSEARTLARYQELWRGG